MKGEEEEPRMSLCLFLSEVLRRAHVSVAGYATQVQQTRPIAARLVLQKPPSA